jgi:alkylated DNA repair dioxygenase AlkB
MTLKITKLNIIKGQAILYPEFFSRQDADRYFGLLLEQVNWQKEQLFLYGRQIDVPRMIAWHGDEEVNYRYSGVDHIAMPWNKTLLDIREEICSCVCETFNGVLLNLYRDGADSMGWHSDDEAQLGNKPVIASVSLGQRQD